MQIINMSKTKLNSLEPLILPKNVTSTECELFKYPYYGKEKLLKKLHRTDGIIFANKLYTIEALNANKDSMPSNFVLPESLVSINKKIEAFTMKYIKGINLSVILNNPDITDIYDIKDYLNKRVNVIVLIDKAKEIVTKKNDVMCYITGSDNTGSTTLIVFPDLYKEVNNFKKNEIIKVKGKVERRFNEFQIICNEIER